MRYEVMKKTDEYIGHFGTRKIENIILREFWILKLHTENCLKIVSNVYYTEENLEKPKDFSIQ